MAQTAFVDCGVTDLLTRRTAEVTGLESEEDGALRVYVGPRYEGVYVVIEPSATAEQEALRHAWDLGGHVLIKLPPEDCLMCDEPTRRM